MSKIQVADTEEENCCYLKERKKERKMPPPRNISLFNEELASEEEFPFSQMMPFTIQSDFFPHSH